MKYYLIDLVNYDENNTPYTETSICISGTRMPSLIEAKELLSDELIDNDCEGIGCITEIDRDEAIEEYGFNEKTCITFEPDDTPESLNINIKYLSNKIEKLRYIDGKSDWIDMRCSENITLKAGEFKLLPLGVAIALPKGYEAHLVPRSSTFKNYGILQTNSMGVIDETYCGDNDQWMMPVYATRDTEIKANDRICQFRIMRHQPAFEFIETDTLGNTDRGGFGSTGKA